MNRRQFVKIITAAGACLWVPAVANAAFTYTGRRKHFAGKEIRRPGPYTWETWPESDQSNLDCDYASKTHVVLLDAPGAGDNETGFGAASGANLVWTQSGNVPGVVADYRSLTAASSQKFSFPVALQNILAGSESWFFLAKVTDWVSITNAMLLAWNNAGTFTGFAIRKQATGDTSHMVDFIAPGLAATSTTGTLLDTDDDVCIACWRKAGGDTRAGFKVGSKITSWAGIPANQRVSGAGGSAFNITATAAGILGQRAGAEYSTAKLHYVIISTEPEIFISD